jgi:hypothetical protein
MIPMQAQRKLRGTPSTALTAALLWAGPIQLFAQVQPSARDVDCKPSSSSAPEEALRLAVQLKTYVDTGFFQHGGGIVIGDRRDTLLIATAAHVVMDAGRPVDSVHAYFFTECSKPVVARLCARVDPKRDLDLAILCVPARAAPGAKPPSFARLGSAGQLGARTPVYPVGCPAGECWGVGQPDKVLVGGPNQPRILFTSFFVAPGHSGGPLFNQWWEVVGMLTKLGKPLSEAIPIDSVLSAACVTECRGQEEMLDKPFVPRGGYPLSLGVQGLFSSNGSEPGDRFPGGRANLMYRVHPLLELHAGAVRLIPDNLSVTGGVLGIGLNLPPNGRVWFNPFIEGWFAHVEGRYDAGGYYIDNGGTNEYVPLWQQVKDDGLGFGTGVSMQGLLFPRTVVEILVAHWGFNLPEALRASTAQSNAAEIPDVFWGAGLRFGF